MSDLYPGLRSEQRDVLSLSNAFDWQFSDGELKRLGVSQKASLKFIEDADKWELSRREYWDKHKYVILVMKVLDVCLTLCGKSSTRIVLWVRTKHNVPRRFC
jgi:hypothetical protein